MATIIANVNNGAGRLTSATVNSLTTAYVYNALGQRIRKSNAPSTTLFTYDLQGHLLGEYTNTGALIQELIWLNDIPVATIRTDQSGGSVGVFYIHTDHLNAPTHITRPSDNQVLWRWDHDPYGNGAPNQDADGNGLLLTFNLRFPGQYYDQETNLYYNGYRYYDQSTGRYISSDPIGLYGGLNTYLYANGQPITSYDFTGLCWGNARAGAHFFGGGGDVTVGEIGCSSQIAQVVQPERNIWMTKVKTAAKEKAASMKCDTAAFFDMMRSIGLQSGIFWIRGFSLLQNANCLVTRRCGGKGNQCSVDSYWFGCSLTSNMHDQYVDPTDWDNSGRTSYPDFWDHWNYGGTPFYVNGTWDDSVSGGGTLP